MIKRPYHLEQLSIATKRAPITALLGPRQCGKTTLARMFTNDLSAVFFDLESQPDLQRLQNPELMLGALDGIVVIDEVQIMPELFKVLRVLADRPKNKARFLILGSASPDVAKNVSQTLAGRVEFVELAGFDLGETGSASWEGFALEQVLQKLESSEAYFWATHNGAEIDLLIRHRGLRYAVEVKFNEAPRVTRSLRIALDDRNLNHLLIVYPGPDKYAVDEKITVWPLQDVEGLAGFINTGNTK